MTSSVSSLSSLWGDATFISDGIFNRPKLFGKLILISTAVPLVVDILLRFDKNRPKLVSNSVESYVVTPSGGNPIA